MPTLQQKRRWARLLERKDSISRWVWGRIGGPINICIYHTRNVVWSVKRYLADVSRVNLRRAAIISLLICYAVYIWPLVSQLYQHAISDNANFAANAKDALLAIGAAVGAPFLLWRTSIASRQAHTALESHNVELFTKAVELLGSDKDGFDQHGTLIKVPNLELRMGGILALDRMAQDSPKDYWRVISVLASYVRNNSKANRDRLSDTLVGGLQNSSYPERQNFLLREKLPSADIQLAIDVIGKRPKWGLRQERKNKFRVDLSNCNLRGIKFSRNYDDYYGPSRTNFSWCDFSGSELDASELSAVDLSNCILNGARLVGAYLTHAHLKNVEVSDADLRMANFTGANLFRANFSECDARDAVFSESDLRRASFVGCNLMRADIQCAKMERTGFLGNDLTASDLRRNVFKQSWFAGNELKSAKLYHSDFSSLNFRLSGNQNDFSAACGDLTTVLPPGVMRPNWWPNRKLSIDEQESMPQREN